MDRRILIVDDSIETCRQIEGMLKRDGLRIDSVRDGTEALELIVEGGISLVLTDLKLPRISGMDLIREVKNRSLPVTIVVMTGFASIESAVEAMKLGAYDYLNKPLDPDRLAHVVERALEDRRVRDEIDSLRRSLQGKYGFHRLVGASPRMKDLFAKIGRIAATPCTVLIGGETGTGKELVAEALHACDPTRKGPLVAVNCAALPETLLESELFGHERGAFTGADALRRGRFELAQEGTLLLDEIGELPLGMQAKLLRVLQDGTFERVGGTQTLTTTARVLAATNLNLAKAVADGQFRPDLYYRLNVVAIDIPPLRERPEDIPLLVEHFLRTLQERGLPAKSIAPEALERLARHSWPGNVRELEHMIELAVVTATGDTLGGDDLSVPGGALDDEPALLAFDIEDPLPKITADLIERIEAEYLRRILEKYKGRIDRCAKHSGLSRRSISEKLRRYRIDKADFKPERRRKRSSTVENA